MLKQLNPDSCEALSLTADRQFRTLQHAARCVDSTGDFTQSSAPQEDPDDPERQALIRELLAARAQGVALDAQLAILKKAMQMRTLH